MRNLILNLIVNIFFFVEINNVVVFKKLFEKFIVCSGMFNFKVVKGGNDDEGGEGIIIEDDVIN